MIRYGHYYFGLKQRTPDYLFSTEEYEIAQSIQVLDGTLVLNTDVSRRLTAGDFCLLMPGSRFTLSTGSEGYSGVACEIWDYPDRDFRGIAAGYPGDSHMRLIGEWIAEEHRRPGEIDVAVIRQLCISLFHMALRIHRSVAAADEAQAEDYYVARARSLLELHAIGGARVQELLSSLPISYRHLARIFARQTGMSPKEFQENHRLKMAREYLRRTSMNISAVAMELGFSSSQHFARAFKRAAGVTPIEYRRAERESDP